MANLHNGGWMLNIGRSTNTEWSINFVYYDDSFGPHLLFTNTTDGKFFRVEFDSDEVKELALWADRYFKN